MSKVQKIKDLIADTDWTDKQIARKVKCSIPYVNMVRNGKKDKKPKADSLIYNGKRDYSIPKTNIDAVLEERGKRYGSYVKQAAVAQEIKNAVFANMDRRLDVDFTVWCMARESLEMICTKMARILNGDMEYPDSWTDISGYAKLMADHLEEKSK